MAVDLFISYSHEDRELRGELAKHLSGLRNIGVINDWFDGDIIEGREWEQELFHHLDTAQIILILVSADFIASKFCYQVEMQRALARHDAGLARVIPIILHPTDWKQLPFAKLQALPPDAKPVSMWSNRHEAYVNIVKGIKRAIQDLHDGVSQAEEKGEADVQPAPGSLPHATQARTVNVIGSIGGSNNVVNQAGTLRSIVTNNYGVQPAEQPDQPPKK